MLLLVQFFPLSLGRNCRNRYYYIVSHSNTMINELHFIGPEPSGWTWYQVRPGGGGAFFIHYGRMD